MSEVLIAVFHRSKSSSMATALFQRLDSLREHHHDVDIKHFFDRPVYKNRNKAVSYFLENGYDNILMMDNDVVPPESFIKMIEYDLPAVSGLVANRSNGECRPLIMKKISNRRYRRATFKDVVRSESDLVEVDALPSGCLAVDRVVFENLEEPWFKMPKSDDGTLALGEDFYFSELLEDNGISMHVALNFKFRHIKSQDLTSTAYNSAVKDCRIEDLEEELRNQGVEPSTV